ncbi:unnamed protein product [Rhodiola kirilowii]
MGAVEKTEEELRKEIEELNRQQWEISQRLRDPRGLRRGGKSFVSSNRGQVRPADRNHSNDQPPLKRRLSSAVVKVEEGEITEEGEVPKDAELNSQPNSDSAALASNHPKAYGLQQKDNYPRTGRMDFDLPPTEYVPRVLPKNEDPSLVNRNKRMLGQLLGTLEKFRKEDMKLSGTEAHMRRSTSLQKAEQRAREESERLRQQEREQLAEKRKRDLTLRARVAAKAEEKKLELLFLWWSEHHRRLCNFQRTKTEPSIYYAFSKPLEEDAKLVEEKREQMFQEWKTSRREELSEYQKQIVEQYLANAEKEQERWQNARTMRKANNSVQNLQETMDKELETHRLVHGPKKRKMPGGSNNEEEEDYIEDLNIGEEDIIDDVLGVDENDISRYEAAAETSKPDARSSSPQQPVNGQKD